MGTSPYTHSTPFALHSAKFQAMFAEGEEDNEDNNEEGSDHDSVCEFATGSCSCLMDLLPDEVLFACFVLHGRPSYGTEGLERLLCKFACVNRRINSLVCPVPISMKRYRSKLWHVGDRALVYMTSMKAYLDCLFTKEYPGPVMDSPLSKVGMHWGTMQYEWLLTTERSDWFTRMLQTLKQRGATNTYIAESGIYGLEKIARLSIAFTRLCQAEASGQTAEDEMDEAEWNKTQCKGCLTRECGAYAHLQVYRARRGFPSDWTPRQEHVLPAPRTPVDAERDLDHFAFQLKLLYEIREHVLGPAVHSALCHAAHARSNTLTAVFVLRSLYTGNYNRDIQTEALADQLRTEMCGPDRVEWVLRDIASVRKLYPNTTDTDTGDCDNFEHGCICSKCLVFHKKGLFSLPNTIGSYQQSKSEIANPDSFLWTRLKELAHLYPGFHCGRVADLLLVWNDFWNDCTPAYQPHQEWIQPADLDDSDDSYDSDDSDDEINETESDSTLRDAATGTVDDPIVICD
ncbi:MAG: hypothetical protein CL504_09585 [Actinobacteria bacterium]|nr:hypothetical protein [Actinomycetota bacterium]